MKRMIRADKAATKFAIAILDNKSDNLLGFLSGFRQGGFYHPGNVVQGTYDFNDFVRRYESEASARRALGQYRDYSEVFMYDPASTDYPRPSEKWKRKEVPTHLEVVPVIEDAIESSTISVRNQYMKRYIHASISPAKSATIAINEFGSPNPGPGNTYIAENGTFVNLYPQVDTHEDLCWYLIDEYEADIPYPDEEYFIREFGWIRLRSDPTMMIVELTSDRPSSAQWYSLQDWLEYCEIRYPNGTTLYLNVCDGSDADAEYRFGTEYFAGDILKLCKRYYTSGKLYASTNCN